MPSGSSWVPSCQLEASSPARRLSSAIAADPDQGEGESRQARTSPKGSMMGTPFGNDPTVASWIAHSAPNRRKRRRGHRSNPTPQRPRHGCRPRAVEPQVETTALPAHREQRELEPPEPDATRGPARRGLRLGRPRQPVATRRGSMIEHAGLRPQRHQDQLAEAPPSPERAPALRPLGEAPRSTRRSRLPLERD